MAKLYKTRLDGNPGIPGCPSKINGENDYLSVVEKRARERLDVKPNDVTTKYSPPSIKLMDLSRRMTQLMQASSQFVNGYEKQLSDLAYSVFMSLYQDIVQRYEIITDIKIKKGKPQGMDTSDPEYVKYREIKDEETIREIHKRKLANLIMQGEAKNTKHIFNMQETKDGLDKIYGEQNSKRAFAIFKEMTEISDQMDWIIDLAIRQKMMEEDPEREFSAGNVKIDWVKKDNEPKIEETNDDPDEVVEEESSYLPKITARGVDFPMLLHEAVKGLYEILAIGGIPEDEEVAKRVLANTGRMDEPEDWRWGPEIASDFRDFINKNPKVDKYPNIREEFFKLMFDKETMSTEDCLELMRGILSKTEKARKDVDKLIDLVIESIDQYYNYLNDMDKYSQEIEEYNRDLEDFKEVGEVDEILTKVEKQPEIVDYRKMSKYELQSIDDEALDNGDFDTLGKASVYL